MSAASGAPIRGRAADALAVLAAALVLVPMVGFVAISLDHTQYLLPAVRRFDPGFLVNDWFVNETTSFHPLFEHYVVLWLGLERLVTGLAAWYAFDLLAVSLAMLLLARHLAGGRLVPAAVILAVGIAALGVDSGWGGYRLIGATALPSAAGYPPAILSLVLLLERRYVLAAVALVATFAVHHGMGALMVLVLAAPALTVLPRDRGEWLRAGLGAALVVAAFTPVILATVSRDQGIAPDLQVFFYGRSPHHFAMRYVRPEIHLRTAFLLLAGALLASCLASAALRRAAAAFVGGVALLCLLGHVLLEVWYVPGFVRLFPYRALPLVVAFNAAAVAAVLLGPRSATGPWRAAALCGLASLVLAVNPVAGLALLGCALLARVAGDRLPASAREPRLTVAVLALAVAVALGARWAASPPRFAMTNVNPTNLMLAGAISAVTPPDAVVVVPPQTMGLRLWSERAIVVNLKAFPVYGSQIAGWTERMADVTGVDPREARGLLESRVEPIHAYARGYNARSYEQMAAVAEKYGAGYVVVGKSSRFHAEAAARGEVPRWESPSFALYALL